MKKNLRNRRGSRFLKRVVVVVFIISIIFLLRYLSNILFLAKRIECYTQYGNCPQVITDKISWLVGTKLLYSLPGAKVKEELKSVIEIKNIKLYRKLPKTLVLSLEMRKPIGTVGSQVLGMHVVADDEGLIIGKTDKTNFPLLLNSGKIGLGDKLSSMETDSLKILGSLNSLSTGQIVGQIEGKELTVYFPENFKVLLDLSHITSNWYTTLQVILTRSKILSKIPKVIDLRFSSPIVSF
jgi:hypothetical protein